MVCIYIKKVKNNFFPSYIEFGDKRWIIIQNNGNKKYYKMKIEPSKEPIYYPNAYI